MAFNNVVGRADVTDAAIPETVVSELIKEMPGASVMLNRARRVNMTTAKYKQPVMATLPEAFWVNGDTGLKQTTKTGFESLTMTAEELAVIVPVPDALIADSSIPLWQEIKPLIKDALGSKVDEATLFGIDKPASWPEAVVPAATAAKNVVAAGTNANLGADVAALARKVSTGGFAVNGFASEPGLNWELIGMTNDQGTPIYHPAMANGGPGTLYGYPLMETFNGSWDATKAKLIAADWKKFVVGIRQDVTFDLFSEGVITDADGKVVFNLMQQDSKALRVVMRVGWQVANPVTAVQRTKSKRYPAGILTPAAATSGVSS